MINDATWFELFGLSYIYFIFLYFGLGWLFLLGCKTLARRRLVHQIEPRIVENNQLKYEIRNSLVSIFIFGLSLLPIVLLIKQGWIQLLPNTFLNIAWGLVVLTLWNELHFYFIHRLMHQPFFMKHIHKVHHRSNITSVFSVYSFHWFEAILLSTVPLTIMPFIPFSLAAVMIFPTVSILLNFAGHCNYRFGSGTGHELLLFGTRHNKHHSAGTQRFGFALSIFDKIFGTHNRN